MSQENLELVRAIWTEFVRGGFPEDMFTDDVTWEVAADEPEGGSEAGPIRGAADIRRMLASFWETVEQPRLQADEFVDAGDSVIVRWRGGGIGRASRLPVEWHETHVYAVSGGRVAGVREYRDFAEALEAVRARENVQLVARLYEAFLRGDQPAILAGLHPEIEWRSVEDTEPHHGHDGVATSVGGWLEMWEEHHLQVEEYLDAGDQVVVSTRLRGRGRQSGAVVETQYFAVWSLRDGQAITYREYPSKRDALEAVGLSE
jgi:uncharacterized protein